MYGIRCQQRVDVQTELTSHQLCVALSSMNLTPAKSRSLIKKVGGNRKFAEILGISDQKRSDARIDNWKRRGIPEIIVLRNLDLFKKLQGDQK